MRAIASCVSSTDETCFAFSAAATSTAVLKLHGDLAKAHPFQSRETARMMLSLERRRKSNDCTVASSVMRYSPVRAFACVANKGVTTWPNISRRHVLAATGGALMGGSIGNSMAATL